LATAFLVPSLADAKPLLEDDLLPPRDEDLDAPLEAPLLALFEPPRPELLDADFDPPELFEPDLDEDLLPPELLVADFFVAAFFVDFAILMGFK
jgi:hypothetical protein